MLTRAAPTARPVDVPLEAVRLEAAYSLQLKDQKLTGECRNELVASLGVVSALGVFDSITAGHREGRGRGMVAGGKETPWPSQLRPEKRAVQAKLAAMVSSLRPRYLLDLTFSSRIQKSDVRRKSAIVRWRFDSPLLYSKVVSSPDWARG
jgi:hypothetical protein